MGITSSDYDDFLTLQGQLISDVIEDYCGRKFLAANYTQTFYKDDYEEFVNTLNLFHYPVNTVTSIIEGTENITADVRVHKPTAKITLPESTFFSNDDSLVVVYNAGYSATPSAVLIVFYSILGELYTKKTSGIALNFGSDVQSISIPGTISVSFDYSLQSNERKAKFGTILGNYINSLDPYRSERVITGSGTVEYVS